MPYSKIVCETRGDVAIIRLNDEKTLNAASPEMAGELRGALDEVCTSSRALILTGTGRGFCSGANLGGLDVSALDYDAGAVLETHYSPLMLQLRALPIPFITAVNGPAAGRARAMEMMLLGDRIPAAKALEWGLINRVVPAKALDDTALALAPLLHRIVRDTSGLVGLAARNSIFGSHR